MAKENKEEKIKNEEKCNNENSQLESNAENSKEKELNEKLSKTKDELEEIKDRHTRLIA